MICSTYCTGQGCQIRDNCKMYIAYIDMLYKEKVYAYQGVYFYSYPEDIYKLEKYYNVKIKCPLYENN
jgi:flavoprotein